MVCIPLFPAENFPRNGVNESRHGFGSRKTRILSVPAARNQSTHAALSLPA
ncbi:MAG: hypothetical protein LBF93_11525 [Zoogloeaceae bacterium]|jgi:hypothetical protein|nr:hypothetical protein [Zoogloeaceae bacterium]